MLRQSTGRSRRFRRKKSWSRPLDKSARHADDLRGFGGERGIDDAVDGNVAAFDEALRLVKRKVGAHRGEIKTAVRIDAGGRRAHHERLRRTGLGRDDLRDFVADGAVEVSVLEAGAII